MNDTVKRFPRTLEEAFGPYTARQIHEDQPRGFSPAWWASMVAVSVVSVVVITLTGCGEAKAPYTPRDTTIRADRILTWGPDEHGVVCYAYYSGQDSLSCVKVK